MTKWGMVHASRSCWRLAAFVAGREEAIQAGIEPDGGMGWSGSEFAATKCDVCRI